MDDKFLKYSKLYILIFLLFLAIPVSLGLVFLAFYGFSKVVTSGPVDIIYSLAMITIMPAIFGTACLVFFKKTKQHPSATVAIISKILLAIGVLISVAVLVTDIISFINRQGQDIAQYNCFTLSYLAGNMGGLFFIAIIQALNTKKEVDWMERNRQG